MNRPAITMLALLLAAPLPAFAATTATYKTQPAKTTAAKTVKLPDGLQYVELKAGKGAMPHAGQTVLVHYTGTFTNGRKFDSSRDHGQPLEFELGRHGVIACWDEAIAMMRVGGRRKLTCPPSLAYGERGYLPVIPPNTTLNFDVELVGVK